MFIISRLKDCGVRGLHGNYSADMNITDKELEVYGVDWAALQNEQLLQSVRQNGQLDTGNSFWISSRQDHLIIRMKFLYILLVLHIQIISLILISE